MRYNENTSIGRIITAIVEIKENAEKPLLVILCCLTMILGLIGYILISEWLFLIVGFILILVLG